MLNGIAPLLMFTFPPAKPHTFVAGIPLLGDFLTNVGVPIPIYLDENLTGIYVDNETKGIDFEIEADQTTAEEGLVRTKGVDSTVTIQLLAKREAPLLGALLAFADQIFLKAVSQNYRITYLNGSTTVFNGLLKQFTTSKATDDDLTRFTIVISKANQLAPTPKIESPQVPVQTGTVPVAS